MLLPVHSVADIPFEEFDPGTFSYSALTPILYKDGGCWVWYVDESDTPLAIIYIEYAKVGDNLVLCPSMHLQENHRYLNVLEDLPQLVDFIFEYYRLSRQTAPDLLRVFTREKPSALFTRFKRLFHSVLLAHKIVREVAR
jgi:hypothetical protein